MRCFLIVLGLILQVMGDKFCTGSGFLLFSGFKVHRQYRVSGIKPSSQQYLILSHCDHGKVDYQKVMKVRSINKIDWESPICLLKPRLGKSLNDPPEDTVQRLNTRDLKGSEFKRIFGRKGGGPKISNLNKRTLDIKDKVKSAKNYIKVKIKKFIEQNVPISSPIIYTSPTTEQHMEDISNSSLQASMEWESRNLACFKLARRKKYAKRDTTFYIPQTFIGGIYECLVSPQERTSVFRNFSLENSLDDLQFDCDSTMSRPLLPLIADYNGKQWWEFNKNIFNPSIIQTIPFLTTSSPLNVRFSLTETPEMSRDTWATKIRVNEDYDYTEADLHYITQALALTSDFIFKLFEPIDFGKLLNNIPNISQYKIAGKPIIENDLVISTINKFSIDQKLSILLSLDPTKYLPTITKLQKFWE